MSTAQRIAENAISFDSTAEKEDAIREGASILEAVLKKYGFSSDIQFRCDSRIRIQSGRRTMRVIKDFPRIQPKQITGILLALYRSKSGARDESNQSHDQEDADFFQRLGRDRSVDFASEGGNMLYGVLAEGRFRVQAFFDARGIGFTCRKLRDDIPVIDNLNIDKGTQEMLCNMMLKESGLCLVTGPTGSGKSTTLASLLNWVRGRENPPHMVTVEQPIEYRFPDTDEHEEDCHSYITQREVGIHVGSFEQGLIDALREAPDIIMFGEIRDRDTLEQALHAVRTGHLVLSTMHTVDATETLGRILDYYLDPQKALMVAKFLSKELRFVHCQRLLSSTRSEGGMELCYESFFNTSPQSASAITGYLSDANSMRAAMKLEPNVPWQRKLEDLKNQGKISKDTFDANTTS